MLPLSFLHTTTHQCCIKVPPFFLAQLLAQEFASKHKQLVNLFALIVYLYIVS